MVTLLQQHRAPSGLSSTPSTIWPLAPSCFLPLLLPPSHTMGRLRCFHTLRSRATAGPLLLLLLLLLLPAAARHPIRPPGKLPLVRAGGDDCRQNMQRRSPRGISRVDAQLDDCRRSGGSGRGGRRRRRSAPQRAMRRPARCACGSNACGGPSGGRSLGYGGELAPDALHITAEAGSVQRVQLVHRVHAVARFHFNAQL